MDKFYVSSGRVQFLCTAQNDFDACLKAFRKVGSVHPERFGTALEVHRKGFRSKHDAATYYSLGDVIEHLATEADDEIENTDELFSDDNDWWHGGSNEGTL